MKKVIADLQDLKDNFVSDLEEGKLFLISMWEDDEDVQDEIEKVDNWGDLEERLFGVDYITFADMDELKAFKINWE